MLAPPFRVGVHTVWDILDPLLLTKISSVKVHCTIKLVCVTEHMVVTSMKNYLKNSRRQHANINFSDYAFFSIPCCFSMRIIAAEALVPRKTQVERPTKCFREQPHAEFTKRPKAHPATDSIY